MLIEMEYRREHSVSYAEKWALTRNPAYLDFDKIGGDCTNFASQCLLAGCDVMNPIKDVGWYYYSPKQRAAAWTSVEYLYRFLTTNKGVGPYGVEVPLRELEVGDLVQLGRHQDRFYHTPIVVQRTSTDFLICAHSNDAYLRELSSYEYDRIRAIHVVGFRQQSSYSKK